LEALRKISEELEKVKNDMLGRIHIFESGTMKILNVNNKTKKENIQRILHFSR